MIPLGLDMMDALKERDITLSVLSATQLGNRRWLQALRTYFLQAEEVSKPRVFWRPMCCIGVSTREWSSGIWQARAAVVLLPEQQFRACWPPGFPRMQIVPRGPGEQALAPPGWGGGGGGGGGQDSRSWCSEVE